ncbi:MAG TPA: prepilin-type N-terminal cleavage/methylation domain-containing protein [Bryobacteraceae bacterium]|nr:prepilin-type N-terminal cleavage/methylation domain-containing protein [Bryobacteraceae bacterium]
MKREAGFTLMEVIIAVTLVSLLLGGVFGCVRLALNTMDRVDARMMRERRVTGVEQIMKSELEGMMPVTADCLPAGEAPPPQIPFFQGESGTMRFVSSYSLQERARGLPRILEFQVIPGENGEGVRLIVNEHLYTGPRSTGAFCMASGDPSLPPRFAPVQAGPQSFVLADKLASCRFEYYEVAYSPAPLQQWWPRWDKPQLPQAIRIEMAPLKARSTEVELQPVTAPLHVTRNPMVVYGQYR